MPPSQAQLASRVDLLNKMGQVMKEWDTATLGAFTWPAFAARLNAVGCLPPASQKWTSFNLYQYCRRNEIDPLRIVPENAIVSGDAKGAIPYSRERSVVAQKRMDDDRYIKILTEFCHLWRKQNPLQRGVPPYTEACEFLATETNEEWDRDRYFDLIEATKFSPASVVGWNHRDGGSIDYKW